MVAQRERTAQAVSLFDIPPEPASHAVPDSKQTSPKGRAKGSVKGSAKPDGAATPVTGNSSKSVNYQTDNCAFSDVSPAMPDNELLIRHDIKPIPAPRTTTTMQKRIQELEHDIEIMQAAKIYKEAHPDWGLVELQAENVRQREQIVTILNNTERLLAEKNDLQQQQPPVASSVQDRAQAVNEIMQAGQKLSYIALPLSQFHDLADSFVDFQSGKTAWKDGIEPLDTPTLNILRAYLRQLVITDRVLKDERSIAENDRWQLKMQFQSTIDQQQRHIQKLEQQKSTQQGQPAQPEPLSGNAAIYHQIVKDNAHLIRSFVNEPIPFERDGVTYRIVTANLDHRKASAKIANEGSYSQMYKSFDLTDEDIAYFNRYSYEWVINHYGGSSIDQQPGQTDQPSPELAALRQQLAECQQQLTSCQQHIIDQADTQRELEDRDRDHLQARAQLEEENTALEIDRDHLQAQLDDRTPSAPAPAAIVEELERVRESEQRAREQLARYKWFLDEWTPAFFANPTIPNSSCKLVYWWYYYCGFKTRPKATGEDMKIGVEATGSALGMGKAAVRSATDRGVAFEIITRTYEEPIKTADGKQYTPMHIMLHDVFNDPESIQMEKRNGGKRIPRCPVCGSDDVDRYTLQYCRHCNENDWYIQPGTRADAPYELAQIAKNRAVYGKGKNGETVNYQSDKYPSDEQIPAMPDKISTIDAQHPQEQVRINSHTTEKPAHHSLPTTVITLPEIRTTTGTTNISQSENYASPQSMPDVPDNSETIRCHNCQIAIDNTTKDFYFDETGTPYCSEHGPRATVTIAPAWSIPSDWRVVENTPICHAQIPLNKDGKPAKALEKEVSTVECGSTDWQWNNETQRRECKRCWAPLPE